MLSSDRLKTKLREFCDPDYGSFRGYPTTRDAARTEWALAFDDYIQQGIEDVTPPMAPAHPTMSMSSVKSSFEGDLDLSQSISAADTAADFAGAWKTAIDSITAQGLVNDSTGNTAYTFISFTNVSGQHSTLLGTLTSLFSNPTIATLQRLGAIAAAFHTATDGLSASMTKTIVSTSVGSPATVGIK